MNKEQHLLSNPERQTASARSARAGWVHRLAILLAETTLLLILVGGAGMFATTVVLTLCAHKLLAPARVVVGENLHD